MIRSLVSMALASFLAITPRAASAQSATWELAVMQFADTALVHGGRFALDSVAPPNAKYGRPVDAKNEIGHHSADFMARARANPRVRISSRRDAVRCGANTPRDCMLVDVDAYVAISAPKVIGDIASVTVDHYFDSGHARQPIARVTYALTVRRTADGWTVTSSTLISQT